ncbi:hypothetical protein [Burkholderia sp. 8Y]|uniref:hypothetical protein n=1 Tax=Burkholderia sp. 8Y TaxID=2653133 RepID=UPI0019154C6C|nr:hypothetical protein [Burkholderia sp. 8Y]
MRKDIEVGGHVPALDAWPNPPSGETYAVCVRVTRPDERLLHDSTLARTPAKRRAITARS